MKVLVTGASGFFGSHIAEQLANAGHDVRVLVRETSDHTFLQDFPHEIAIGDIADAGSLPAAVEGVDGVVHAAGLVKARSEAHFAAVNGAGTANLLAAITQSAPDLKRFVYVSSLTAHGPGTHGLPRPIDAPSAPVSAYGRTKLLGEIAARQSPLANRSVILRMPVIYGPRDPALVPFFQSARFRIAPLLTGGHNRISVVYVDDAVSAVIGTLTSEADVVGKIYTPEDGEVHTWRDLLKAIEDFTGSRALRIYVPRIGFDSAAFVTELFGKIVRRPVIFTRDKVREMAQSAWVCSSQTLKQDLGWEAQVDITEGARRTGQWYRDHKWI
ncbi:MAG: NAD-dependent epimerase/dehydratase family protein [Dehalococcoidia bacterium]